jgi:mannosyltransferase OCH1-like enzyme
MDMMMKIARRYNPVIPLHVYMTWKQKPLPPLMQQNVIRLMQLNPEFTFHIYSDEECLAFIQQHFTPDVADAFDALLPGAYKADLWRLCILYIRGGYYMDIKLSPIKKFRLIELSEGEHFVRDRPKHSLHIYNALMVCKANNPFLFQCIRQIVHHVKIRYYGSSILSPTGPEMLGRIAQSFKLPIDLVYPMAYPDHIMYNGTLILKNYNYYRNEQRVHEQQVKQPHYFDAWFKRQVYKINIPDKVCVQTEDV